MNNKPLVSVLIPFLNESLNIPSFYSIIESLRNRIQNYELEFIFIDDGSTDESLEILKKMKITNSKIISFARNYGSHYALFAGIDCSKADYITFMSADFQEPLELYIEMLEKIQTKEYDIILGQRRTRNAGLVTRFFSWIYLLMMNTFIFQDYPKEGVDVFLINNKVRDTLQTIEEKNSSIIGLLYLIGYKKGYVFYSQKERAKGKSKWTGKKKFKIFFDSIISFSVLPLRFITFSGILISILGFSFGFYLLYTYLFRTILVQGYTTIVALITFGFGLVFLMLGIISEYLWRMFDQVRPRPRYIIKEKIGFDEKNKAIKKSINKSKNNKSVLNKI